MKKIILAICFIFVCSFAQAQCVPEIKDVYVNTIGQVYVQTDYFLNGKLIHSGGSPYLDISGTNEEIIEKAKLDARKHCKFIIKRIESNDAYVKEQILLREKEISQSIVDAIKQDLVGFTSSETKMIIQFKGIEIEVTADEEHIKRIINP